MTDDPIEVADFEHAARRAMAPADYELVATTMPGNLTVERTRAAWDSLALRPRVLPGIRSPDLAVDVVGCHLAMPVLLGPAGFHTRAHPDGELATARAAAAAGTVMTVSANPGHPAEVIAQASDGPKWLQLYLFRDREETTRRVRLAEDAGYAAICLTLDAHWPAKREARVRRRMERPTADVGDDRDTVGLTRVRVLPDPQATWADPGATWVDVAWLRTLTKLPIVCKGIMTGDDARRCVEAGAAALIVSNHGGRLDNTLATIEVLPEVVEAVAGRTEILLDGGVRRGADVVKALALGARAVLLGRPVFWGLAQGGAGGLALLLDILREEVEMTMMLCGRPTIESLDPTLVTPFPPLGPAYRRT